MSNEKQETVADIVKELRGIKGGQHTNGGLSFERWRARCQFADDYADRIEAAWRREILVERNLATDHIVCLQDKLAAQVCGEIGEMVGREAARMSDERAAEKYSAVVNAAAMREALEAVVKVGYPHNFQKESPHIRGYCHEITTAIKKCFDALSSPPRNCDRHECATTKAAQDVWCKEDGGKTAYHEWLYAEAEGGTDGGK